MKRNFLLSFAVSVLLLSALPVEVMGITLEDIKEKWRTKVITDVPTAGIGIMLERFDMTWPTASVGDACQVLQTGVEKKVLDDNDGYTVEVDAKNGYVTSYHDGSDRQTMSACVWRRSDGHRLFAVVIEQPVDPSISIICFYDYDPQKHVLTPEPEIVDNILPLFPTAYMSYVLPREGKDLVVLEYSSGWTYRRIYKWDGMLPVYDRTEKEPLFPEDTDDDFTMPVSSDGSNPTIADFVTACFKPADEGDELTNHCNYTWQLYRERKPLPAYTTIELDKNNGYMKYECSEPDGVNRLVVEVCYWNCDDGVHKVVAENVVSFRNNRHECGQYDGLNFYLYDSGRRAMKSMYTGLLCGEEFAEICNSSAVTISLPRYGKSIQVAQTSAAGVSQHKLNWDGSKFEYVK